MDYKLYAHAFGALVGFLEREMDREEFDDFMDRFDECEDNPLPTRADTKKLIEEGR